MILLDDNNNNIINDDDDEDEMLDLFSFGADASAPLESTDKPKISNKSPSRNNTDAIGGYASIKRSLSNREDDDENNSHISKDSFIEFLENAEQNETILESIIGNDESHKKGSVDNVEKSSETTMQEILDWLDDDDKIVNELKPLCPPLEQKPMSKPDPTPLHKKCQKFENLKDAVMSHESSKSEVRQVLEKKSFDVSPEIRPHLWSKMICDKTLEETRQSSLADSFQQWEKEFWQRSTIEGKKADSIVEKAPNEKEGEEKSLEPVHQIPHQISTTSQQFIEQQLDVSVERILASVNNGDFQFYRKALQSLLWNHFDKGIETENDSDDEDSHLQDRLIAPVLSVILSATTPTPVACVMFSQIIPSFMPMLSLTTKEREETAMILHRQLYLLASYHLPLLVLHLDKFIPGWYNCHPQGKIPQSWLISLFAGETGGTFMNAKWLLPLWDIILATGDNSLKYFLVISILDLHAERLLLLTGNELQEELSSVLALSGSFNISQTESTARTGGGDTSGPEAIESTQAWVDKSNILRKETPTSVIQNLKVEEDNAIVKSLLARQEAKEEKLRLQQEAAEKAQQDAREAEKEQKAEEARTRLTRARLVAFYRQHNPGKENNIDKIMVSYKGRYEILDAKLKLKYGVGFNPAIKPKPVTITKNNSKILSTMNSGFGQFKSKSKNKKHENEILELEKKESTIIEIPASEVLPSVCGTRHPRRKSKNEVIPFKYFIVDCREEAATKEQGRFSASVAFTPKRTKEQDPYESLRASVHICIMGEGYSALPQLYGHKMTSGLAEMIKDEEERKSVCARFFLSRGFPFVSLMQGGFASAHAHLCREGPKINLNVSDNLIDYDPEVSLFGQFEKLHSMSSRDKAQRSLQNLFDSSMTVLTKHSKRLESLASENENGVGNGSELAQQKVAPKIAVKRFFGGKNESEIQKDQKMRQTSGKFRDSFTRKMQTIRDGKSNSSKEMLPE